MVGGLGFRGVAFVVCGIFCGAFAVWIRRARLQANSSANAIVAEDQARYDSVWTRLVESSPAFCPAVKNLNQECRLAMVPAMQGEAAASGDDADVPLLDGIQVYEGDFTELPRVDEMRSQHRGLTDRVAAELYAGSNSGQRSKPGTVNKPRQRINLLGPLLGQAAALNGHFQDIVAGWADNTNCIVAFSGATVHTCSVKRRTRAIEKLFRSYSGDARWLIDLVRAGVTFRTLDAMRHYLRCIRNDARVAILQIKNRFRLDYDSGMSAGYRNLSISLLVVDELTMRLGVDAHVCELQLGLEEIDSLKNDQGHHNYVTWRNARAE